MNSAVIVGAQPLYRMAIIDLLKKHKISDIKQAVQLQSLLDGQLKQTELLVICISPGDEALVSGLAQRARISQGVIVLFSQVFGKRHKQLIQQNKVDLCLPLSVHCSVADDYLSKIMALKRGEVAQASMSDNALKRRFLPDLKDLSNSEQVVLFHLSDGISNRAIAERMNVQLNTVKVHLARACRKAGFSNRTQAAMRTQDLISCCG
ncbi:MAG: LuxR C-terminal-related transcriptional regulator [Motiliproteus sp.]